MIGADSPGSDVDILLAQLALEEAQAEALKARRLAEERDMAVRLSQTRLKVAEARRSHDNSRSRSRVFGKTERGGEQPLGLSQALSELLAGDATVEYSIPPSVGRGRGRRHH